MRVQIQGGHKYRPPRVDVNAPDLYLPLVSCWTYVILLCLNALLLGKFKPDIVYSKVRARAWEGQAGIRRAGMAGRGRASFLSRLPARGGKRVGGAQHENLHGSRSGSLLL